MNSIKALAHKLSQDREQIINRWIEAIDKDHLIGSSNNLEASSLKDHLPHLLEMIFLALAGEIDLESNNPDRDKGNIHGVTRALQDFKTEEIAREYYLLKQILLAKIEPDLLASSPQEIIETIATVNQVIDEIMANSFKSYTQQRLNQLENLHHQLLLTNQELTRLVEDHQENLCYLAHEIKSPLTAIIGYSDLFLRQQHSEPMSNKIMNLGHIEQVLTQGRKILRLVNDSLEISSYKQGKIKLSPKLVDVCQLLDNVTISLKSSIEAKGLKLITSCTPEPLQITIDPLRLQQIITNLVTNAIRYTETGTIKIYCEQLSSNHSAKHQSNRFKLQVSDTGIGICQADYQRIFEPYCRIASNNCQVREGIGLGLAIVSQLVKLLNGEIQLESEVGVGSTFIVILPID